MSSEAVTKIRFGPFEVTSQVFLQTPYSFALVNLKPLLPGHVLVCPTKPHKRLTDLTPPEVTDLFATVQRVERMLARGSFNIAVQDGPEAGQTVSHVHVHIIPRIRGLSSKPDEGAGDELYERMAGEAGNVGGALWDRALGPRPVAGGKFDRIEDSQRGARSMAEMEAEAEVFRRVLREMEVEEGRGQA
ncbi:Bis(5'-nucleosyl)-tetraphosphatase [asymmetrical] [Cytospora mali]|uniref:Bis(5'-adenosyl)-triphosphatase n=1 Tax=Cytospora mali TaxID=578113 RepID=A0A194UT69_CYTMA|nr:Bis(5'-nucleosyl)-tetraphosphatase [asymmetrical] [Valsa mali var. pyri (nom. inval.)]